ncbi:carbon storage regulator [Caloramator proteoclasticus]|uniref:Translational regulator CsrA n=1 Tax=Caloramator proteoclasticus DSM 10124 TaxID=1121262 RepID=A0A1M4SV39_9CLOT|nr:carbon storage regulator [Caloramator proteoclasticus]SHE36062.1 carbon storage regulator, CsrA [Caloramator proteoclasticus DSM 10124]
MLILTRKVGEKILIGENIEITILENNQGNIKIGIEAPKDVRVVRYELIEEVKEQNRISLKDTEDIIKRLIREG